MDEWIDLYDAQRRPIGKRIRRGERLPKGAYHWTVHVCIFNDRNEMLIQKRSADKISWGGLWDTSASGVVQAGEEPWEAAEREVAEELGIVLSLKEIPVNFTMTFSRGFDDYWIIEHPVDLGALKVPNGEVEACQYAGRGDFERLVGAQQAIPYALIDLFYGHKGRDGAFMRG